MGDKTKIEWTDKTWNPWHGCRHVSEGCRFCYMFREKRKYGQEPTKVVRSKTTFFDPLKWNDPANVFTCSWSDWFIKEADEWRPSAWAIIKQTPHLTYQILTKRIERAREYLPDDWGSGYPNVWLGVSCEDQKTADVRIPRLVAIPAAIRFISAEPLLGPIDLQAPWSAINPEYPSPGIHWVIAGGESGNRNEAVRPSHPDWFRSLRDQCVAAGVPYFFKQWGEWLPGKDELDRLDDISSEEVTLVRSGQRDEWGVYAKRVGKKAAGRLLDGREWNQLPKAA